ncbi:MAG: hypothetical protein KKE24_00710 [Candidatus Thermoplasmatota archaeon]|nr:hypothetical protein [Candidatus Thermoplasmatota archaeon]
MAERLSQHPILSYLTFGLPLILLAMGIIFGANVFLFIITIVWLGVAFMIFFVPMSDDNGSSR